MTSPLKVFEYHSDAFNEVERFFDSLFKKRTVDACWHPSRFVYARYLVKPLFEKRGITDWEDHVSLWRDSDGKLVGIALSEAADFNSFFFTASEHRYASLKQMLGWAMETNYCLEGGRKRMTCWADQDDNLLITLLKEHGFDQDIGQEYLLVCDLNQHTQSSATSHYLLSILVDPCLYESRMECVASAFQIRSHYDLLSSYTMTENAPNYRQDLDFCLVDPLYPNTVIAACTGWQNHSDNSVYLEPFAVAPQYQGKGIGTILLRFVMTSLKHQGFRHVYVATYGDGLKYFYCQAGFSHFRTLNHYSQSELA